MDAPKFVVSEVSDLENGLRRVTLRLSDKTAAELATAPELEHGSECSMSATLVLPAQMLPFAPREITGFAKAEAP